LPSHCHRPIVVVVLNDINVDVIVIVVVIVITAVVFHFPIINVAIATILVVGAIVVAVTVIIDIVACRCRACRAPWLSIQGIRPKQAKAVSPMAWGWSACGSPLPYRIPIWERGLIIPIEMVNHSFHTGIERFMILIFIWGSPYGNGD
jgi:hypothetical protein